MEGDLQIATQTCGDEEFYEKIEAPKFVDLTAPDRYRPDDCFWFCLRVGCDRKHEEEIDHEAISKDFVLRVMAARSPNVRLRKALDRNTCSIKDGCPHSAPAKPTKSRIPKLPVMPSISQKNVEKKVKTKPNSKITLTPKVPKAKQVAAKYLTTPSHKFFPSNTNKSFRSVQNPKPTNIAVPKNKIIAKALFKSPKKGICVKTSAELRTPLTKLCQGMKKLSITSQRKRVLGYSSKSSKDIKRKSICKDKSKASSSLRPLNGKEHKSKYARGLKRKSKEEEGKIDESIPKVVVENEPCDMESDKSKASSSLRPLNGKEHKSKSARGLKRKSKEEEGKIDESMPKVVVENEPCDMESDAKSRISKENNINAALANAEEKSIVKFDEANKEIDTKSRLSEENTRETTLTDGEEKLLVKFEEANDNDKANLKDEEIENDDKEKIPAPDYKKIEKMLVKFEEANKNGKVSLKEKTEVCLGKVSDEDEEIENDDKENYSAPDYNRSCQRNALGKSAAKSNKKVITVKDNNLKEGLKAASATSAQATNYKKPKPTNPKPFRLRTDERVILREANMERRAPVKERPTKALERKNQNNIEKQNRPAERSNKDRKVGGEIPNSTTQQECSKLTKQCENEREILGEISEKLTRKTKPPSMQPHFMMPIGRASTRKTIASDERIDNLRPVSRGKRSTTVAKVPNV